MRLPVKRTLPLAVLVLVAACGGGGPRPVDVPVQPANGPAADYPVVVGDPFTIDGVTYTPQDTMNYDAVGFAASGAEGGDAVSAAHRTLPLPSYAEVTALETGKTILVRIERRGPMAGKALTELSPGAAVQLGYTGQPQFPVRLRRVNPTEPERALLRSGQPAPARMDTPKSLLTVLMRKLEAQGGIVRPVLLAEPEPLPVPPPSAAPAAKPAAKAAAAAKPKAAPKSAAIPEPVATPNPAAPPNPLAQGRYSVRVGSYGNKANAEAAAKKTGGAPVQSGKFWVVTAGPFAAEAQAKAALAKARSAGYSDARIQRAN
jgi:rare lipoprotein A